MPTFSLSKFLPLLIAFCLFASALMPCQAQAVYVPSRLTDLTGGQNIKSGGPVDRPGYFGMQNLPANLFPAATTATCGNYRVGHGVVSNVNGLRLLYLNAAYQPAFNPALANTTTITVRAAVEIGGVTYPVFFNGSRSINIDWGGYAVSDPLSINVNAAAVSNIIYSRTEVTVPTAGLSWPTLLYSYANTPGVSGHVSAAATDLTLSTGALDNVNVSGGSTYVYGPSMILARKSGVIYSPSVAIVGDSIASQSNDAVSDFSSLGWPERACLAAGLGCVKVSIGSDATSTWSQDINHSLRGSLIENCGYCIDQLGINEMTNSADFALQQANNLKNWNYLTGMGMKVYKATIAPSTTSTDNYLTAANQSFANPQANGGAGVFFATGTVASAPTVGGSTLAATVGSASTTNAYAGYCILMTSGAAKGIGFGIASNTAGTSPVLTLNVTSAYWTSTLPAPGDTFEISTNRVCANDWYRQVPSPLTGIIETADAVECNAAGAQTRNGGYWWSKPVTYSGKVTAYNGANGTLYNLGDYTTAPGSTTPTPLYGYQSDIQSTSASVLTWTSGTQIGRSSNASNAGFNSGGGNNGIIIALGMMGGTSSPYTASPVIGDTYTVTNCIKVYGNSGPHPGTAGHEAIAIAAQSVLATFK